MMAAWMIFCLRWAVVLTMLYSLFGIFMKRETLHSVNRIVLLFVLIASLVLPMCQIETRQSSFVSEGRERIEKEIKSYSPLLRPGNDANYRFAASGIGSSRMANSAEPLRVGALVITSLLLVYMIGLAVCWLRYFWSLVSLLRLIRQGRRIEVAGIPQGVHVITHEAVTTPCSWMGWIILHPADVGMRPIIEHELAHIRLGHSWDMLLCELTCRMLWPVPFAWMLRQDLRDVHEYQADQRVLAAGINDTEYQLLLIKKATGAGLQPVVNALNQSPIKRRLSMMYQKPSRRRMALKAVYVVPLSALALVAFARPQTMSEIEEKVKETAPAIAQAAKTLTQQFPSLQGSGVGSVTPQPPKAAAEAITDPTPNPSPTWEGSMEQPDSNLVKADLAGQSEDGLQAKGMAVYREVNELADSVMQAVGARRIAEGTYVGHFQPNLNSDTVRIRLVSVLDKQSKLTMASGISTIDSDDPLAYELTLQQGTRKDEKGYYIRYLQPVNSTVRSYDKPKVDPKMLSTDSVLTGRSNKNMLRYYFKPVAIEQSKQETRIFLYIVFGSKSDTEILKEQNIHMYKNLAVVDDNTGDKYVCRSTDYSYFKHVKDEVVGKDTVKVFQTCLVFPPLGKRVREAHFASINERDDGHRTFDAFDVTALHRKARVITQ